MTKLALFVQLKAKHGKEEDVADFLKSAQALLAQEPLTVAWFAVRFDKSTFGIFDAFDGEEGRQAHLQGQIAAALMAKYDELFEGPLDIKQAEVLADRLTS
ncbi:quinol monooxygenase YgiN [Rhizobium binae]|uniref:Quinol monooxygenase YgiN n=1 Tax=Rhizobium binae TaxID=1138190 RepID=A0ABV2MR03_9HYPH|nr:antibiotic biosynthesis monooxygenase [Rhizobium binae]MBX4994812.1 antibiotic biosynthesis monooxygenase [Rhizobium binae]NKL51981.1 antibiotic biosynthesis monooxygenase [Rhizobium leguminosarum bv. viciae]QSY85341.1 antibiotic biosynthesis monooxygenase [Rhizobium binae]